MLSLREQTHQNTARMGVDFDAPSATVHLRDTELTALLAAPLRSPAWFVPPSSAQLPPVDLENIAAQNVKAKQLESKLIARTPLALGAIARFHTPQTRNTVRSGAWLNGAIT
jgi:hypothetical protein